MPCMCGDIMCASCGPAQGNYCCPACGQWASEGPCENPERCAEYAKDLSKVLADYEDAMLGDEEG